MVEVSKDGLVPVTQADREAAARLLSGTEWSKLQFTQGKRDKKPQVQAFARHRIEATATLQAERDRYRVALEKWVAYDDCDEADFATVGPMLLYARAIEETRTALSDAPVQS